MSQTLLPFARPVASAEILRPVDLYHQLNSILAILQGKSNDTPIPGMWRGYLPWLYVYGQVLAWRHRQPGAFLEQPDFWKSLAVYHDACAGPYRKPPWMGDPWIHRSHRSRLLSYDYNYYSEAFPGNPLKMPMIWPRLDDSDSRGYRLFTDPRSKMIIDKGLYRMPVGLRLSKQLEVISE